MFGIKKKKEVMKERPGLVVSSKPNSVVSEQFRTIRTNIQFSMVDERLQSLVITSAGPGSGKSIISANLAATFASEDKKVLLVDADLRKPTVHKTFRVRNNDGLTTLLTDRGVSVEDMVYRTHISGLYVLTSGAIPPNPAELLGSKRMDELMKEFEDKFDFVIYDMPPILAVTDAQVMASKVDGTIFVLPKGQATKEAVFKAKELLNLVDANVLGAIFNRVEKSNDHYYYYYGEE
ncbi:CpsD/CapB family tyrosine-protein kinase [Desemzia incerta]|uniref:CpsD/CapB family tyrosine-protein kinase n=1 Tax=Desemzia incerta TaxID=82801 RepID=UPI003314AA30